LNLLISKITEVDGIVPFTVVKDRENLRRSRIMKVQQWSVVVTIVCLLLGAWGNTEATELIIDANDNVIRIENLEVFLDQGGSTVFNVDFVYDTAFNVYGESLELPFTEEDAINALAQVNDALNAHTPVPPGAGTLGTSQFFIGAEKDPLTGFIGGVGSEYFSEDGEWNGCDTDCIYGVAVLDPAAFVTYADFTVVDNGGSGNEPPVADADGPYTAEVGVAVVFDGAGSSDPDGNLVVGTWDFGDGTSGSGEAPSHAYSAAGVYHVSLTVTDDSGAMDSDATVAVIGLGAQPPVADAGGPYIGVVDVSMTLDGTGSSDPDGSIVAYDWDFGDGNIGSGATPSHAYIATGIYYVTLMVTDNTGEMGSGVTVVVIGSGNLPPQADAGATVTGVVGEAVSFDGTGSKDVDGTIVTYDWAFGDGNTGTGPTPTHTYSTTGGYNVTLTVIDDAGATDSDGTVANIRAPQQETTVIIDANDNVIRIENLEILLDQGGPTVFDVNFVYDTAFNVYGESIELPFTQEDAINALAQVNDVLNAHTGAPVPSGAGTLGTSQFFIGADQDPLTGLIGGVGSEYFSEDGEWDGCDTDCISFVAVLDPAAFVTYADFTVVAGGD
jgi:PKD repeat protein